MIRSSTVQAIFIVVAIGQAGCSKPIAEPEGMAPIQGTQVQRVDPSPVPEGGAPKQTQQTASDDPPQRSTITVERSKGPTEPPTIDVDKLLRRDSKEEVVLQAPAKIEQKDAPPNSAITEIEGKSLHDWVKELTHEDPSVREKAIRAVVAFGPQATAYVPQIVDRCIDPDSSPRCRAVIALTIMDIQEKDRDKVIEALNRRLVENDPQGIIRYHAALALCRFGEEAKAAIPGLVRAVNDSSSFDIRRVAIMALRQIGRDEKKGPDDRATRALLGRLASGAESAGEVKLEAIIGLAMMGRPADANLLKSVETTLKAYANSEKKILSIWAHYGLMAHDKVNEADLQAIAKNAASPDVVTRVHTAQALGTVGPKAKHYAKVMIDMLPDRDNEVFVAACSGLVNLGEPGPLAIKALTDIAEADAKDDIARFRKAVATRALEGIKNYEKNKEKMDEKKDVKKDK